jgi:hypothetical protein
VSVSRDERHTRQHPCIICGGHDTLPRGKEVRCHGFTSSDGKWCQCSRISDGSVRTIETATGTTYLHLLRDEPFPEPKVTFSQEPSDSDSGVGRIVATYDYFDVGEGLLFQVVRYEPKAFKQRRPNGSPESWIWNLMGIRRTMFRRADVAKSDGVVFLCEGEKDALALATLGLCSTTSSGGASSYRFSADDGKELLRGRDVCIVQDQDEDGRKYADGWVGILSGVARAVRVVDVPSGKDAADWVATGATAGDFFRLWQASEPAKPREPIEWIEPVRLTEKLPPIDWICEGMRLAPGVVSCFSGYGYSGKTAIGQLLLLSVANGRPFLGLMACKQGLVGHLDYEQGFRLSVERMQRLCRGMPLPLEMGLQNLRYCPFPEVYLDNEKGKSAIAKAVDGLKLVLIDSSRAAMPGVDENDSKSRVHVDSLSRISEKTGTGFLLICHDGKSGEAPRTRKERTRGSSAMFDAMQTMWGLEMKDGEDFGRADLRKDRLTGSKNAFGYRFEDSPASIDESPSWLKIHHLDPEQMKGGSKLLMFRLHTLQTIKANPGLTSIETICMAMPDGFRHASSVRATVRDLEKEKLVTYDRERGYVAT